MIVHAYYHGSLWQMETEDASLQAGIMGSADPADAADDAEDERDETMSFTQEAATSHQQPGTATSPGY